MTPAEKRIKELIDRWLTSIELHLQYVDLSDDAYAEIQSWPKHDRPTRWVLELAKQKANELKTAFDARHQMGDSKFADSLELMSFLANLVGAQHVDRFVPLAEPQAETAIPKPAPRVASAPSTSDVPKWYAQAHVAQGKTSAPVTAQIAPPPKPEAASIPQTRPIAVAPEPNKLPSRAVDPDATREMPKLGAQSAAQPTAKAEPKTEQKKPSPNRSAHPGPSAAKQPAKAPPPADEMHRTVIADAQRLIAWGRTWHELAELIARMADRPPLAEVRKILRAHRTTIEKAAKETSK